MQSPGSSAKKSLASATQSRASTSLISTVSPWQSITTASPPAKS